jgi:hypothetical protein
MNTPVSYNVPAPAPAPAAAAMPEKKESGGVFGWLGSLFGGSSANVEPSTNTATVGGRRRTRKGTRKGRKGSKGRRGNSRRK